MAASQKEKVQLHVGGKYIVNKRIGGGSFG